SVVNYDGYVRAYTTYRRDYDSDFDPEGNTDYQRDYALKIYDLERPDYHQESVTLTVQGTSTHVNSEGEVVHGFSEKASAPLAAAEPLGLMSFSDGSPGSQSTSTTIKSLDDFQNYNQFEAFLDYAENFEPSFSDGTASVKVVYSEFGDDIVDGISQTETLHIHEDFFSTPGIETKELRTVGSGVLYIVVINSRPPGPRESASPPANSMSLNISIVSESVEAESTANGSGYTTRLRVERYSSLYKTPWHLEPHEEIVYPPVLSEPKAIQSIEYRFPESMYHPVYGGPSTEEYVKQLEDMFLETPSDLPSQDRFTRFLSKMAEQQAKSSHYRFLPPIIHSKTTTGNL
ncbi:hypothetical protein, partial [Tindallia californiensis]